LFSIEVRKVLSYRVLQEHTLSGVGKNFLFAATVKEAVTGPVCVLWKKVIPMCRRRHLDDVHLTIRA
jgi:hypothetical protein